MIPRRAGLTVSYSYLKAHVAEVIRDVSDNHRTLIITHRGRAKVVVQDVAVYEQLQESLALLKMLAQSRESLRKGRGKPLARAFTDVRERIRRARGE